MSAPAPPPSGNETDPPIEQQRRKRTKKPRFFATENPDNPTALAQRAKREAEFELLKVYAEDDYGKDVCGVVVSEDHDRELARLSKWTGMTKHEADKAIAAYSCLQDLPELRDLQRSTQRLDLPRLLAVSDAVADLGDNVTPEVYSRIDAILVALFTPERMNQELPTASSITRRINRALGDFDSSAAYDPDKRKKREEEKEIPPGQCELSFHGVKPGIGLSAMTMTADIATMAATKSFINAAARAHAITQAEALIKLITGEISPEPGATINGFAPKRLDGSIDMSASVFIPGFGWTDAVGTDTFHSMAGTANQDDPTAEKRPKIVDLDVAAHHSVGGYVAPDNIKDFVRGRDGTCIYPGCDRSAWACQLDHRIPYDEGGRTEAANLYCLCQTHHNVKTDKRAFYIADPVSGDIVWLFPDGTYALTEHHGFIHEHVTPAEPRWQHSLDQVRDYKRKKAHFFARCHKLVDDYEASGDYDTCIVEIEKLEKETHFFFPMKPKQLPDEPDFDNYTEYDWE